MEVFELGEREWENNSSSIFLSPGGSQVLTEF